MNGALNNIVIQDTYLVFANVLSDLLLVVLFVLICIKLFYKDRGRVLDLFVAVVFSGFVSELIKNFVNSPRPISTQMYEGSSFPSTHTTLAFCVAFFYIFVEHGISKQFLKHFSRSYFSILAIFLAIIIGILRIICKAHYPIDVLAGVLLSFILVLPFVYYDISLKKIK
jgi:membrane-associated phospholipid phosphatase